MTVDTNFFVTFPISGTQTVTAGTSRIDFIRGRAILADESTISLANRSTQIDPLQSIFFNVDVDINIELSLEDNITYKGLIPAGHYTIKNVEYDLMIITTSASTEISIVGSHDPDCIVTELRSSSSSSQQSTIPIIYKIAITNLNTEYSQALPATTKQIEFRCRTKDDIRYAFETGKVAGPTDPYKSLLSGEVKSMADLNLSSKTLYVACGAGTKEVELEVWT